MRGDVDAGEPVPFYHQGNSIRVADVGVRVLDQALLVQVCVQTPRAVLGVVGIVVQRNRAFDHIVSEFGIPVQLVHP